MNLSEQLMEQKMKVDFNNYDFSIKELIRLVEDKLLDIAPTYQRQFRWDKIRQSSLIESLFLGIPIPSIFTATNADGTWELIDGVQRVSTIISFIGDDYERSLLNSENSDPLRLVGLEKLDSFNGKAFKDLPLDVQNKFLLTVIKVTALSDKSDMRVRFDLFERLNKGGIILSDQEIRSCVYRGQFNDFISELAHDENFVSCVHVSDNKAKAGLREELVLRFFAYFYDLDNFSHSVKDFLNNYMAKASKKFAYRKNETLFRTVFLELNNALENGINKGRNNTPLNLYEGVAVGAAKAFIETGKINTSKINDWINDEALLAFTTGATNTKSQVVGRIEYCRKRFEE